MAGPTSFFCGTGPQFRLSKLSPLLPPIAIYPSGGRVTSSVRNGLLPRGRKLGGTRGSTLGNVYPPYPCSFFITLPDPSPVLFAPLMYKNGGSTQSRSPGRAVRRLI